MDPHRFSALGRWNRIWWIAIVPAVLLRVRMIFSDALWYDEAFSVLVAALPLPRLVAATAADVHPPLYYLLLKLVLSALPVPAAAAARLLSLALGVAVIPLFYRATNDRLATIVLAYMPAQIFFSSEARMYALFNLLILIAMQVNFRLGWLLAGVATGFALLTHNAAFFYAPVVLALVLRRHGLRRALAAAAVAAVLWLPWAPVVVEQAKFALGGNHWARFYGVGTVVYSIAQSVIAYRLPDGWWWIGILVAIWLLIFFGLRLDRWTALAFVPGALGGIFSAIVTPAMIWRSLFPSSVGLAVVFSRAIRRSDVGRVLAVLLVILFGAAFLRDVALGRAVEKEDPLLEAICASGEIYCNDAHCLTLLVRGCNVLIDRNARWLTRAAMEAMQLHLVDGPDSAQYAVLMDAPLSNQVPDWQGSTLKEWENGVYHVIVAALAQ